MPLNTEMVSYVLSQLDIAKEDLNGAKYLIDGGMYRISLNRSYYCVFHCLKALAVLHNQNFSKHSGNIAYFQKEFIKTGILDKEMSKIVTKTKALRESGDYGDMATVNGKTAYEAYCDADKFYSVLSKFINDEIKSLS